VAEEYEEVREDHYINLRDQKYLTLKQAREGVQQVFLNQDTKYYVSWQIIIYTFQNLIEICIDFR
jgi:hypothetical protein